MEELSPLFHQIFGSTPRKGDLRKVQLIEEAMKIIAEEGLEALTYERLGQPFKMARSHVNYYFKSRSDILEACVRYGIIVGQNLTMKRLESAKNWKQQITAVIDGALDWLEQYPEQVKVLWCFNAMATTNVELKKLNHDIRKNGRDRMQSILEPLLEKEKMTAQEKSDFVRSLQDLMYGWVLDAMSTDENYSCKRLRQQIKNSIFSLVEARLSGADH